MNILAARIILFLIDGYRRFISPLKSPRCRYYPSCSKYAMDAVGRYGAIKGIYLSIKRILRCNPFFPGGYDPVK